MNCDRPPPLLWYVRRLGLRLGLATPAAAYQISLPFPASLASGSRTQGCWVGPEVPPTRKRPPLVPPAVLGGNFACYREIFAPRCRCQIADRAVSPPSSPCHSPPWMDGWMESAGLSESVHQEATGGEGGLRWDLKHMLPQYLKHVLCVDFSTKKAAMCSVRRWGYIITAPFAYRA